MEKRRKTDVKKKFERLYTCRHLLLRQSCARTNYIVNVNCKWLLKIAALFPTATRLLVRHERYRERYQKAEMELKVEKKKHRNTEKFVSSELDCAEVSKLSGPPLDAGKLEAARAWWRSCG